MRNSTPTQAKRRRLLAVVAVLLTASGADVAAARASGAAPRIAASPVTWDGPAPDGGYACLRDTGGASGQCNEAMGIGEVPAVALAATDGGYACLRDTGGASGQCKEAMGAGS